MAESKGQTSIEATQTKAHHLAEGDNNGSLSLFEGKIVVMRAQDDELLEDFERAITAGDSELSRSVSDRLMAAISKTSQPEDTETVQAELVYDDSTKVPFLFDDSDPVGVNLVPYDGGEIDLSKFRIDEDKSDSTNSYTYKLIAIPPSLDKMEVDAKERIPADIGTAAVMDEQKMSTTLALVFAAGVVVGASAAGSASLDSQTADISVNTETGTSVNELIEAREEQMTNLTP